MNFFIVKSMSFFRKFRFVVNLEVIICISLTYLNFKGSTSISQSNDLLIFIRLFYYYFALLYCLNIPNHTVKNHEKSVISLTSNGLLYKIFNLLSICVYFLYIYSFHVTIVLTKTNLTKFSKFMQTLITKLSLTSRFLMIIR